MGILVISNCKSWGLIILGVVGGLALGLAQPALAVDPQYVISISVDGLGSSYLQTLLNASQVPNFQRLTTQGAFTMNARTDYDMTVTLPNHVTQVTSRGVIGVGGNGHNWTSNSDPPGGTTIHSNKGSYVAGVFDVAHDNGLRTGMYATKTKFSLFDTSYNATYGAPDTTGPDNGCDKLDTYVYNSSSSSITSSFLSATAGNPFNYAFLHYTDGDSAGHTYGWGSTNYNNAIKAVDGYLGQVFNLVDTNPTFQGKTAIILTADHGGTGNDHGNQTLATNYTLPFYVWGPGVTAGADLYALNLTTRLDPVTGRPLYSVVPQPIRNADGANLALDLLGLGSIPGSTVNSLQNLAVPEPATLSLLAIGGLALVCRRGRGDRHTG